MKLNKLIESWDGFSKKSINKVLESKEPLVSIVMLSWRRYYRLFECLEHLNKTLTIPVNISLRVQECLDKDRQSKILSLVEPFYKSDVLFTSKNEGTGVPRHERLHNALEKFNTPFIQFTDDDMEMPKWSIELLTSILIDKPEFGSVNMWTYPNSNVWRFNEKGKLYHKKPKKIFNDDTVALGSATLMVRKEVYETCDLDYNYYIGCADIDFGLQVHKAGWKMGMLAIPGYMAKNKKGGDRLYNQTRTSTSIIRKSVKRFWDKWGQKL